jgi:hypothetical protein
VRNKANYKNFIWRGIFMKKLWFEVIGRENIEKIGVPVERLSIIGYAGRNIEKTKEHIEELAAIGVPRPKNVPEVYSCSVNLLTQKEALEVVGEETSGEVEFIVLKYLGEIFVGIGSDHTDRNLESVSVIKSKQICAKPVGEKLWRYEDIKDHWDLLEMISWQVIDDEEILYQKGTAADLLPLEALVDAAERIKGTVEESLVFSGTVPLVDGFKYGSKFRCQVNDKVLKRSLEFEYSINVLPN